MAEVRAIERGYYAGAVREEGEVFFFDGPGPRPGWVELVGKGDAVAKKESPSDAPKPTPRGRTKGKGKTVESATSEPFADAPEPMTVYEAQRADGGIEPDWIPPEHMSPKPVTD